ncbi:hypothetical protein ACX801_20930 [Arthrobacter bambusae]
MNALIPVNRPAGNLIPRAPGSEAFEGPPAPSVDELTGWEEENYQLSLNAALSLGFPVAAVNGSASSQILIYGVSRFKDIDWTDGNTYRYGVALRVLIHVLNLKGDVSLTLPMIAAKVQIGEAEAMASVVVKGYKGTMKMPGWQSFDVTAYSDFQKAVSDLQDQLVNDKADIVPDLLASTAAKTLESSTSASVGSVFALDSISRRKSLERTLEDLGSLTQDDGIRTTVENVFSERLIDSQQPSEEEASQAQKLLHGIHLAHHWRLW